MMSPRPAGCRHRRRAGRRRGAAGRPWPAGDPGPRPGGGRGLARVARRRRCRRRGERRHRRRAGDAGSTATMRTSTPNRSAAAARWLARASDEDAGTRPGDPRQLQADRSGGARRRVPQDRLDNVRRQGAALQAERGRDRAHAGELAGLSTTRTTATNRGKGRRKPALRHSGHASIARVIDVDGTDVDRTPRADAQIVCGEAAQSRNRACRRRCDTRRRAADGAPPSGGPPARAPWRRRRIPLGSRHPAADMRATAAHREQSALSQGIQWPSSRSPS